MTVLALSFSSGEDSLSVRKFEAHEAISSPFRVNVWAVSPNQDIDFASLLGKPAGLHVIHGAAHVLGLGERAYRGVVSAIAQTRVEVTGLASYELTIVPALALLAHRRDHRIFQHASVPEIVKEVLASAGVASAWNIDVAAYPPLEMRVQHGESDLQLVSRLLEEAGISYLFEPVEDADVVTFTDSPQSAPPRDGPPLPFVDNPNRSSEREYVTGVDFVRQARPGGRVVRDHDFRNPGHRLSGQAQLADAPERDLLYSMYSTGAFLIEGQRGGGTPVADGHGIARHSEAFAADRAARALAADRTGDRHVTYQTNAVDLAPGTVFEIEHPVSALPAKPLLATDLTTRGSPGEEWVVTGRAVLADVPFRPPHRTPKPRVRGLQTATVVGPPGQEIHTDEFGRVRVRFPWDRSGATGDRTSCWLRVSQGWAGTGFGWAAIPRVGQEVTVSFFEDDPDQPVILNGVYNGTSPFPHPLPQTKNASVWRSRSSPASDGASEIFLDDTTARELFYLQAERDLATLVRRNETTTTNRDVAKLVKGDESRTTGKDRTTITRGERKKKVLGDDAARVEGDRTIDFGGKVDTTVRGSTLSLVEGDSDLTIVREERVAVGGTQSVTTGEDRHDTVLTRHAVEAGTAIHLVSDDLGVFEALAGITLKTPGGFVLIDGGGIVIKGPLVKINSGGAPGTGAGSSPEAPALPREAPPFEPPMPLGEVNPDGDEPPPTDHEEQDTPPPAPGVELTWIEIVLKDAAGKPVGGERYRILTPDGKVRVGNLDGEGKAREDKLVPGECQVTFPDLDSEDWE